MQQITNNTEVVTNPSQRHHPNIVTTNRYTFLTFLPLNIIKQLRKPSTFFFFITLILLCIPAISPFGPWTYMIAFFIVVGISMVKDAMEDYRRYIDDKMINNNVVKTVEKKENGSSFVIREKLCMDLEKGDWLLAERNTEIQADVVLLRSKSYYKNRLICSNHCFIQTANIDGESSLKKRNSIAIPSNYPCNNKKNEEAPQYSICPCAEYFMHNLRSFDLKDTGDIYNEFECNINFRGDLIIANEKNVLLRGSIVKNTENALCLVVGVGEETKQAKSIHKSKKNKTLFDSRMNEILSIVLVLYAIMMISTGVVGYVFLKINYDQAYLNINSIAKSQVILLFSNYILYIYLIPLGLYVMLEVVRVIHAFFVNYDLHIQDNDSKSVCRNSNAVADLGFIDYILTDKTGTITKNSMTLRSVHLAGSNNLVKPSYLCEEISEILEKASVEQILNSEKKTELLVLLNMLACNSVEVLNGQLEGISQEEMSFLEAIKPFGFELLERDENFIKIKMKDETIKMNIIGTYEFTSKRQRMTILYELFGKCYLLTKGSDHMLLDKSRDSAILKIINSSSDQRSLVMKYREISKEEVRKFKKLIVYKIDEDTEEYDAEGEQISENGFDTNMIQEQKQKEEEAFKRIEKNATYLGTVFIEDELQEEVQETMRVLREAGINVWMITGDKKETAIACGRNSSIIENADFIAISGKDVINLIDQLTEENRGNMLMNGLQDVTNVLNEVRTNIRSTSSTEDSRNSTNSNEVRSSNAGSRSGSNEARRAVEESSAYDNNLFDCRSIIVYRATPSQKGKIAAFLVKNQRNILSIGDGNNDVAMLKNSHVGVGIMGKEGTQAALSADFAIPKFKFLKNLIFIHGRYSLIRYSKLALNSYYKNIVFIFTQFIYNLYSGASGRPLYNAFILNYYNLFFTSLIPFSIAIFDKDNPQNQVLNQPATYKNARVYFKSCFICSTILFALLESALIFFLLRVLLLSDISAGSGILGGFNFSSTIFSIVVISSVLFRQFKTISFRTVYNDSAIALSIFLNLLALFWIQEIYSTAGYTIYHILGMPMFYFVLFSMGSLMYMTDVLYSNVELHLFEKNKYKY